MDQGHVLRFLPDVIRRTIWPRSPLEALCEAMVAMLDPVDRRLAQLERYFDPFGAPTAMLPYLATWVDLGWLVVQERADGDGIPPDRLRRLIAMAPFFAKRRGTPAGLEIMLQVATGVPAIKVRDATGAPAVTRPFHLVVQVPRTEASSRRLVELIVRYEKPVHLTHEVALVDGI